MAVNTPWSGDPSRYSDSQYERACVLDRRVCGGSMAGAPPKERCSLPIREPGGAVNANALGAAAGRLNQVDACPAAKRRAASALASAYRAAGMPVPSNVTAMAGGSGMSPADHMQDVQRGR